MTATAPALLDDPGDLCALRAKGADPDVLFASFAAWAEASGTVLYPAQEEALIEMLSGANVVLATPTGSGKWRSSRAAGPVTLRSTTFSSDRARSTARR
jgi:ATP-dependent helicase YprA (DUF1998 family)